MTNEDINRLGDLLHQRDSFFKDSMNLESYIESAKKKSCYLFSDICNALRDSQKESGFKQEENIFIRIIRENEDTLFKFVCTILENEEEKLSKLAEENKAQIEAIKIDFGEENA